MHVLSTLPERANTLVQKGLREPMLCDSCEQKLSVWEGYAKLVLRGGTTLDFRSEGSTSYVGGLDYAKFRLFQLSVLWRAGMSSLKFFENVRLGPHREVLRQLLVRSDPGSPNRYCCFMFGVRHEGGLLADLILQPVKLRMNGQIAYRFVFGGFLWAFLVASEDVAAPLARCTLRPDGTAVIVTRDAKELRSLGNFADELVRMGRA